MKMYVYCRREICRGQGVRRDMEVLFDLFSGKGSKWPYEQKNPVSILRQIPEWGSNLHKAAGAGEDRTW